MFAIIEVGSRQYKVLKDEILYIPRVHKKKDITLNRVLLIADGKDALVGTPYIKGAKIICDVLADEKGPKRITFKYRRRKSSMRKVGHRDLLSRIKVKDIVKGE